MTATAALTRTRKDRASRPRILALGLGNLLLGDDGAGVHAVRRLRHARLPGVLAVDVGTAVLDALHLIERADCLLAIDALRAGGAPGTLYALAPDSVRDDGVRYSAHELSLLAALRLARRRPLQTVILAVEPALIDFSDQLSEPVARALPALLAAALRLIEGWKAGTVPSVPPFGLESPHAPALPACDRGPAGLRRRPAPGDPLRQAHPRPGRE